MSPYIINLHEAISLTQTVNYQLGPTDWTHLDITAKYEHI